MSHEKKKHPGVFWIKYLHYTPPSLILPILLDDGFVTLDTLNNKAFSHSASLYISSFFLFYNFVQDGDINDGNIHKVNNLMFWKIKLVKQNY